jgi:hypothetical protein
MVKDIGNKNMVGVAVIVLDKGSPRKRESVGSSRESLREI